ncbi:SERTA domain-containing protein 3 isoform X2 [Festucalex cinctus]
MIMKPPKRKLQPDSSSDCPGGALAWERQRQFVFSVSLHKYQRDQELAEPSLRRSVLISNTLRQVEACRAPSLDRPPHEQPMANDPPSPAKCRRLAPEDWSSLSADPDFSVSPAVSSILTGLDSGPDASAPPPFPSPPFPSPRAALRSLENLPACPDAGGFWLRHQIRGARSQDPMEREAARAGYLKDVAAEDAFRDIDTAQLERDMGVLGLRSDGRPPDEDPACHGAKGLPSISSFGSPTASFKDGLELEHLMSMLVES